MPKSTATQDTPARTAPLDVNPEQSAALAAAYDGIYHIFGGRVENWNVTEDGLIASGFTVDAQYDPERILNAVATHVRRAPLMPTLRWIMGEAPTDFATPGDVTTFTVQYFKGTDGADGSKVPEWVRDAAQSYKNGREGFYSKRGPKAKGIQFSNLSEVSAETLTNADVQVEGLQHLIEVAQAAINAKQAASAQSAEATAVEA